MRIVLNVIAVLLFLAGGVWFLQGMNVLGGSVMSGQMPWVVIGAIAALAGIGLFAYANRRVPR